MFRLPPLIVLLIVTGLFTVRLRLPAMVIAPPRLRLPLLVGSPSVALPVKLMALLSVTGFALADERTPPEKVSVAVPRGPLVRLPAGPTELASNCSVPPLICVPPP